MCAWGGRALGAKGVTRALSKLKLQHTHPQDVTALCGKRQTAFTRDIRAGVLTLRETVLPAVTAPTAEAWPVEAKCRATVCGEREPVDTKRETEALQGRKLSCLGAGDGGLPVGHTH